MKRVRRALIVTAILGSMAFAGSQIAGASSSAPEQSNVPPDPFGSYVTSTGPELAQEQVLAIAEKQAQQAGEPNPGLSIGTGTLEAAMRTINPLFNLPEPSESPGYAAMLQSSVYLVSMTGQFKLTDAHLPRGASAPTGAMLDLVIDAHTGGVVGRALPTPEQQAQTDGIQRQAVVAGHTIIRLRGITGTITGVMRIAGGPRRTAQAGVRTASHAVVTARHPQVTVRTVTNAKGVFTLHVFPGGYRVSGSQAGCVPAVVRVRAYRVTRVNLLCSIR